MLCVAPPCRGVIVIHSNCRDVVQHGCLQSCASSRERIRDLIGMDMVLLGMQEDMVQNPCTGWAR